MACPIGKSQMLPEKAILGNSIIEKISLFVLRVYRWIRKMLFFLLFKDFWGVVYVSA